MGALRETTLIPLERMLLYIGSLYSTGRCFTMIFFIMLNSVLYEVEKTGVLGDVSLLCWVFLCGFLFRSVDLGIDFTVLSAFNV